MSDMRHATPVHHHHTLEGRLDQVGPQRLQGLFALEGNAHNIWRVPVHPTHAALAEAAWSIEKQEGAFHLAKVVLAVEYLAVMNHLVTKLVLGATLTAMAWSSEAQVLTQPNLPDHGFAFTYGVTNVQPEGFDWSTAFSIQNVNFDFVPADSTAYAEAFPQADFSQQVPGQTGGINESFYEYNPEYFGFWGGVDGASGIQVVHPEAVKYLPYPMAIGDVHQDSLSFGFMAAGLAVEREFSVDMEALDAGTLLLPNGQMLENTFRIQARVSVFDSSVASSGGLITEGVQYWTQDMPLPVAQTYTYTQIVDGDSSVVFAGAEFLVDATADFQVPFAASLKAFPSPANHTLNVVAQAGSWVRVVDLKGQTIERRQLTSDRESWDVSTWPAGLLFLQVEGSHTTRRVLITH